MSGKWLQRLIARHEGSQSGSHSPLETLKTAETPVSKVLKVANLPAEEVFHLTSPSTKHAVLPLLKAYADARQRMELEIPTGVSTLHWDQALTDVDRFLIIWGTAAADLGWPVAGIFEPPNGRVGGLAWELGGGEVVGLARWEASIEREGQRSWFCIPDRQPVATFEPPVLRPMELRFSWRRYSGSTWIQSNIDMRKESRRD